MQQFLWRTYDNSLSEQCSEPPAVVWDEHTGHRGRPKKRINEEFLRSAVQFYGPTKIARFLGVDKSVVEREIEEYGLVHTWSRRFRITDPEDIQHLVLNALSRNPEYGSRILKVSIKVTTSLNIARERILQAMPFRRRGRHGPPRRRRYSVLGPNSIWHHDGQHGKPQSLFLTFYDLILTTIIRPNCMGYCHLCLHRWLLALHYWHSCVGQQQSTHRPRAVSRCLSCP